MSDYDQPWHSNESSETYRKWFPVFPNCATFDTVGFEEEGVGLPITASSDLKKKVLAAVIASRLRISLRHAEKEYLSDAKVYAPREAGLSRRIDRLFASGHDRFSAYIQCLLDNANSNEEYCSDLSAQFFYRNIASLDAAKKLSELGYLCEVAVILRSMVEQFAFAAKLRTVPATADLKRVRPIACINYLKAMEPTVGPLYGLLSKYTHFEFDHHTHFFGRSQSAFFTIQKDSVLRGYSTHLIFLTMVTMARYMILVPSSQQQPQAVIEIPVFIDEVVQYSKEVCTLFRTDSILKQFHDAILAVANTSQTPIE